jgi:hypothetical protein
MVISRNRVYLSLIAFILLIFFVFLQFNDVLIGDSGQLYTNYDSVEFYKIRAMGVDSILHDNNHLAYKAYPIFISIVHSFYSIFFDNPSYQLMVFSNLFIYLFIFWYYYRTINTIQIPSYVLFIIALEPSLLAFSLTLEREFFLSAIFGMFILNILYINNIFIRITTGVLLFIIILNTRFEVALFIIICYFLYLNINFIKNKSIVFKVVGYFIFLFFCIYFLLQVGDILQIYLRHIRGVNESGLGANIANLPSIIRITLYSLLYYIMPVTIFSQKIYLYQYFLAFSGFTYSFFWIFLFLNHKEIKGKLFYIFLLLFFLHIGLGGTLFNIRHRIELVFPLIILFLSTSKILTFNYGYNYLKKQYKKSLLIAFILFTGLSGIYHIIKYVLL